MTLNIHDAPTRRTMSVWITAVTAVVVAAVVLALTPTRAHAIATPVPIGTTLATYGVLGGATVTNTGPTVVNGLNVGVSPGTAITGFPPGIVTPPGTLHAADAHAGQAKVELTTAYNQAAGQSLDPVVYNDAPHEFGGQVLTPGLYRANSSAQITGTLTLDAQGDPNAVWVFQIGSTLTTAAENSTVSLVNGASPCNVFWQVGSSATLGTNTSFVGTILANTSISATTGATINGRLLADAGGTGDGAVTLDTNRIFLGPCATGGTTGGLVSGGLIAGATTGDTTTGTTTGTTGSTTVGAIAGVPTGGGTGGTPGGLLGGVLTSGGTTGGLLGGLVAGTTTSGTTGATIGGVNGGGNGGPGHDHGGQPGRPGGHGHGGNPEEHGGHDEHGGKPDEHGGHDEHGGKPDEHGGHDEHGGKPDEGDRHVGARR
ncbi:ice-binding family protein [Streptomyces sp. MNU76]|uniref:ice-binding family protein n=1 Tax=Streptomyces sp. MNU76 TaxID=2560026 RepID=UPI001E546008|nr:ice-binding family protein [Streptomyces sp. MNU76]MCC9706610.1 ice-binding family protein [Streptomyces sp. MNU76]